MISVWRRFCTHGTHALALQRRENSNLEMACMSAAYFWDGGAGHRSECPGTLVVCSISTESQPEEHAAGTSMHKIWSELHLQNGTLFAGLRLLTMSVICR